MIMIINMIILLLIIIIIIIILMITIIMLITITLTRTMIIIPIYGLSLPDDNNYEMMISIQTQEIINTHNTYTQTKHKKWSLFSQARPSTRPGTTATSSCWSSASRR